MSSKILILYASQTGMTQDIATTLHDQLVEKLPNQQFELANIRDLKPNDLTEYGQVIFGCSTWDHGIPAPDAEDFLSQLTSSKPDLTKTDIALFGVGDSIYPEFCGALPLIQTDLESCGAVVSPDFFTIDGFADTAEMAELVNWSINYIRAC